MGEVDGAFQDGVSPISYLYETGRDMGRAGTRAGIHRGETAAADMVADYGLRELVQQLPQSSADLPPARRSGQSVKRPTGGNGYGAAVPNRSFRLS